MDTGPRSISRSELLARLGRADAPLILDVRRSKPFEASPHLLPGAIHCTPENVEQFARGQPAREVVAYCVYGHGVGCEAARMLADAGWDARFLAGGIEGGQDGVDEAEAIAAWRAQALPTIRKRPDFGVTGGKPSKWITSERPKIDRIACPWLIRRFIDPRAQFFYVPLHEVLDEAKRLQAVPYDVEGAAIAHEWERCTFDALVAAFALEDPALVTLASIVRGADTSRPEIAAQSAGLLAISLGLSRLHEDDHAMLEAAMPVYDALYAWYREARHESHDWKAHA